MIKKIRNISLPIYSNFSNKATVELIFDALFKKDCARLINTLFI